MFHPREKWAAAVAASWVVLAAAAFGLEIASGQYLRYTDSLRSQGPFLPLGLSVRALAPLWLAWECLRFYTMLRRRLALGLADPLVVHRVGLWGLSMAASSGAYVLAVVHRLSYGTGLRAHVWALSTTSALAMTSAICIGFAFFPPPFYRRWVARRRAGDG